MYLQRHTYIAFSQPLISLIQVWYHHLLSSHRFKVIWSVLMLFSVCLLSNTLWNCAYTGQLPRMECVYSGGRVYILYTQYVAPLPMLLWLKCYGDKSNCSSFLLIWHLIVLFVLALVFTSHAKKYNLFDLHFFTHSISFSKFLISASHKILFAELDYTNASFPLKCQMAPSNSTDPLSQSLEPTVRSFSLPLWVLFVFAGC